jgi:hypothetical protein
MEQARSGFSMFKIDAQDLENVSMFTPVPGADNDVGLPQFRSFGYFHVFACFLAT